MSLGKTRENPGFKAVFSFLALCLGESFSSGCYDTLVVHICVVLNKMSFNEKVGDTGN